MGSGTPDSYYLVAALAGTRFNNAIYIILGKMAEHQNAPELE
jgi:hypothetical protein